MGGGGTGIESVLMRIEPTPLKDAAMIRLDRRADERGWFARSFCAGTFAAHGLPTAYPQHNISFNVKAGTVRGLHYQAPPHEEPKVIRCTRGAIFDVLVDLRPDSPTFRAWFGAELSEETGDALFAPAGFAHGFQTLRDDSEVSYLMGTAYVEGAARGVRFDDPSLAIAWPRPVSTISERDLALPLLSSGQGPTFM